MCLLEESLLHRVSCEWPQDFSLCLAHKRAGTKICFAAQRLEQICSQKFQVTPGALYPSSLECPVHIEVKQIAAKCCCLGQNSACDPKYTFTSAPAASHQPVPSCLGKDVKESSQPTPDQLRAQQGPCQQLKHLLS